MSRSTSTKRKHQTALHAAFSMGTCPLTQKRQWNNKAAAKAHLRKLTAAGDLYASKLRSYLCDCNFYHVGHKF